MKQIKFLGLEKRDNDTRNYKYSIFICPSCNKEVVKKSRVGKKQKFCSHDCYAKNREARGAYKEKGEINGYLYIYKPTHPNSIKSGYVAEHRLVAEEKIGRFLKNNEVVHHINEKKHDNSPDNLQVMTASEHNKLHAIKRKRCDDGKYKI